MASVEHHNTGIRKPRTTCTLQCMMDKQPTQPKLLPGKGSLHLQQEELHTFYKCLQQYQQCLTRIKGPCAGSEKKSYALPSSDEVVANTKGREVRDVPTHSASFSGEPMDLLPTCFALFLDCNFFFFFSLNLFPFFLGPEQLKY